MRFFRPRLDPDLVPVDAALRRHRTELPADALAALAARAVQAAPAAALPARSTTGRFRVAVVSLVTAGLVLSGGGAGVAVSGLVGQNTPATVQYGAPTTPNVEVLGAGPESGGPSSPGSDVSPQGSEPSERGVQAPRQLAEQGGSSLPFTGWATIPVMLAGFALLGAGLVLRRRTRME